MPSAPVISPNDQTVADLSLAADGLLGGHRASITVPDDLREAALAAGELIIADAETMPVVRLHDLTAENDTLTGLAERANSPTGVGHQLRTIATPDADRTVVVLTRPLLAGDLPRIEGDSVLLVTSIACPSPDGVPVATMLRLAQHSATALRAAGQHAEVATATLHWRDRVLQDPATDRDLASTVAASLGAQHVVLDPTHDAWREALQVLNDGGDLDAATGDRVISAELQRWRRPRDRRGFALFFPGLSGAGKSTIARAVRDELLERGERTVTTLDGDEVRRLLSAGLGFGAEGRDQNVRRIGYVAAEVTRHGGVAICAPIAPYETSRAAARAMVEHAGGDFLLVHVATSLEDCEARDIKGLYARARSGEIAEFTGISDPYEAPANPELRVQTAGRSVDECAAEVLDYLRAGGWLSTVSPTKTGDA